MSFSLALAVGLEALQAWRLDPNFGPGPSMACPPGSVGPTLAWTLACSCLQDGSPGCLTKFSDVFSGWKEERLKGSTLGAGMRPL